MNPSSDIVELVGLCYGCVIFKRASGTLRTLAGEIEFDLMIFSISVKEI